MPVKTRSKAAAYRTGSKLKDTVTRKPRGPQTQVKITGCFFPFAGKKPIPRVATYNPRGTKVLPRLPHRGEVPAVDLQLTFSPSPPSFPYRMTQTMVSIGRHTYLVAGYQRHPLDRPNEVNQSLREVVPNLDWRGEVVAFCVGSRVPLLSRTPFRAELKKAIALYLCEKTACLATGYKSLKMEGIM